MMDSSVSTCQVVNMLKESFEKENEVTEYLCEPDLKLVWQCKWKGRRGCLHVSDGVQRQKSTLQQRDDI